MAGKSIYFTEDEMRLILEMTHEGTYENPKLNGIKEKIEEKIKWHLNVQG